MPRISLVSYVCGGARVNLGRTVTTYGYYARRVSRNDRPCLRSPAWIADARRTGPSDGGRRDRHGDRGLRGHAGRLTGKRVSARLFVDEVAAHGAECCNYLLAVDVEMNTVDGYSMSGWDTGYGDMVMRPDLSTFD